MSRKKCPHGKQKYRCKDCGGKSICQHNRRRSCCKKCGGSQICQHNRIKSRCKKCKGGGLCEHNRRKFQCKECKGGGICKHNRQKSHCKECGGSQICEHNRQKFQCKECKGSQICEHNKRKSICKECKGSGLCKHNIQKFHCKECGGGGICEHNRQKFRCIKCNPSKACQLCKHMYVTPRSRYKPYCFNCYCYLNPNEKIPRRYKIKENYLVDFLKNNFPDIKLIFDKIVDNGCSLRRPDVRLECFTHTVIIECDENKHSGYTCESKRIMQLFQDLGNRPLIVLRFNPDLFEGKSCFKKTKAGGISLNKREWNRRTLILSEKLFYHKNNIPKKELIVEHLFY